MGVGKTYLGECLTRELDAELIDTDKMIEEREGMEISAIFKEKGEKYFRSVEKKVLEDLVFGDIESEIKNSSTTPNPSSLEGNNKTLIIATGGGLPVQRGNRKLLKMIGSFNICLNPPFDVVMSRIKGSKRPLVYRRSRSYIFNLWQMRYSEYQKVADVTISEVGLEEIIKALNERVRMYMNSELGIRKYEV